MNLRLLAEDIDAVELEPLGAAQHIVAEQDAIDEAQQCALEHLHCQLVDLVVLVEEDGFEGLPVLDVPAVQVVVLLAVLGREGRQQRRHLGVAALYDHQLFNITKPRQVY